MNSILIIKVYNILARRAHIGYARPTTNIIITITIISSYVATLPKRKVTIFVSPFTKHLQFLHRFQ
jgi:hypothetical protein